MKNTTLLKVLSATAIFSAVAAIEAYDQDNFAFAAEETPIVANNSTTSDTKPTTTKPAATPAANSATASSTAPATTAPKTEEPATVAQDVKALKDGEYKITAEALNFYVEGQPSMAASGLDNEKTKLIVKNGQYSVSVTFKPITFSGLTGYLGDLKYYDGDKTHKNRFEIEDSEFKDTTIVENYTEAENEKDAYIDTYKKKFPNRTVYPKTFIYSVDKNKIDDNNKLETYTQVFVPVMESGTAGAGTQNMILKFDLTSLSRKKVTADNYEAATYENPNKDVEYTGKINKEFPIHVQGHFRNANNNDEESHYGSALDSYVRVEKVGDKYKYTLRFKKGLANVGGEFYPFELKKLAYEGKDVPFTTLAKNADSSINEASITTDKLLEKIQLDGTAPYPNGVLMSHFVTLKLYYETATPYKERPAKLEEVVVPAKPKPTKPTPAPVKPKEEPKPAAPTVADHTVTADKVPTTFPTTVKGELYAQQDNTISGYAPSLEKDITIEKVGNKYKYTFNVKENKGTTKSTSFFNQFTKIAHNGTDASLEKIDKKTKKVTLMSDNLLDIIPINTTVKNLFGSREVALYLKLDFPTVENAKEEVANNSIPAKIYDAHVANKLSMANGALVHEKTRVEKVNDTYHYYLTFKDLRFGALVGTVETLTVDNTAAGRTDLGGENHEKVFHFTSPEKLTEKTIRFSVSVNGKPFAGHSNVPATLKFNWDGATPLTADQVTSLHNDETTKAQAEKERLEKEVAAKAEKEKAEADRLAKEKAEREKAEADRLAKEKAEREKAEADRLAKEKAEREKAEADRLAKEKAEREKAEADRLAKEKAEREKAEADKLAKEKADREKAVAERLAKEKAERLAKEKAEREKAEAAAKAEKERLEKEVKAVEETVTELKANKAQLEKLVKEKEEAINNATTEVEKEKLTTEKAEVEKKLTAKVTELKAENEKVVKLKFEAVKNQAVENIFKDGSLRPEEAKQLEEIVKNASLKDTLVAKVTENDPSEDVTVTFDNTAIKADKLVVQKADKGTVAKVEKLVKNTDENLSVVKTIDLHFEDSAHNVIDKKGVTRAVTVAVVANENDKLEVYYVNEDKVNGDKLEKVPSAYKDGKLTFFTNHFSRYTIVKVGKTVASNQDTTVPIAPAPSDKNEEIKSDKGKALVQEELPALNINELSKEQNVKEETQALAQNIFGQVDNKENKNVEVEKTVSQNTSQTVAKGLKQLAKTGLNATATAGLGILALLSALVLRRKNNK
ncbi:peptidase [Gemella sp.]